MPLPHAGVFFMEREMKLKARIMDEAAVMRAMKRISHEIIERNDGVNNLCLVGIRRRGMPLANLIADNLFKIEGSQIPVGELDITFYRDDLTKLSELPTTDFVDIGFDVSGNTIILVDDVIYTGRTVRAAIDAIFSIGRPAKVQLAVLIDRGHRELPIRPDFVGKNIPTSQKEMIAVRVPEYDGSLDVSLYEM